ncbi:MAG: hypothetical protein J0M16_04455 [Gammaproteobacteria bacterium]|nr:hypothetical protein [Gammaproteobacteria bacterium]
MLRRFAVVTAGILVLLLVAAPARSGTLFVTSGADSGPGTLRQAIIDASSGDRILFAPGVSTVELTSGQLLVNKNLRILGPGASLLTVRRSAAGGTPAFRIFEIGVATVTLADLTVANGDALGGGIRNSGGTLTVLRCAVTGNAGPEGAGIYSYCPGGCPGGPFASTTIDSTLVAGNVASATAGGIENNLGSGMVIVNSTISGNSAFRGGAIYSVAHTTFTITSSTITGNQAADFGGGVVSNVSLVIRNSIIALNSAASQPNLSGSILTGGYNVLGDVTGSGFSAGVTDHVGVTASQLQLGPLQDNGGPTATHALLSGSLAIEAGLGQPALRDQRGLARVVDSLAVPNASGGDGSDIGAYEVQASVLPGCNTINTVVTSGSDSGPGTLRDVISSVCAGTNISFAPAVTDVVLTTSELTLNRSMTITGPGAHVLTIQRSSAPGTPPFRIFNVPSGSVEARIAGLTISNGDASSDPGGGIRNSGGTLALSGIALTGNSTSGFGGGGLYNEGGGVVGIESSTIAGNVLNNAFNGGAGIANADGTVTIANSTLSGNVSTGFGGAIFTADALDVTSSTIAGNSASGSGGGIASLFGGAVTARNTVVALNTGAGAPNVSGALGSDGFNVIGDFAGATITPALFSDQLGVTPAQLNLGPLQANGGPTETRDLLPGSVAIDKGSAGSAVLDQRGAIRPDDQAGVPNAAGGDGSDVGAVETGAPDTDGDGVPDPADNCTLVPNASQCDSDGDGYGNRCDGDLNNNGFTNAQDTTLLRQQLGQPSPPPAYNEADLNCNGFVNAQDVTLFRSLLGAPPGPSGVAP